MGQPKRHIEISWLQVAELPTFPTPMVKLVWDPENLPYKLAGMMGGSNPEYYWSGFVGDNLMGTRNVHSSDTPVTFSYGSNYPGTATKVAMSSFLSVGVLLSESVLEYNEQFADRKHYPYAVQRELNQVEVGRSYIPFLAQIVDVASFVGHFCGLYPGPLILVEMAKAAGEEGISFHSTMYSIPLPLHKSATPLLDSIYTKWTSSNIHVMMYGGCLASRIFTEMWHAKMTLPTPGKFWFGDWQKLNFGTMIGSTTGNEWEQTRCLVERDVLAGWVYHDALYKPTSYDKFCRWYVPLATPTTLPWTANWVSTTMREWYYLDQWTAKHWGPGVESGYTPYSNYICSGRDEADLQLVTNYPYGSHYASYDEMTFFWAQSMDSMWQLLWGHESATRDYGNAYSVSDWLSETESAPGYGFFQDFNPGAQTTLAHQNVWVQYTREVCSLWYNHNGDVVASVVAEYEKDTHGVVSLESQTALKPVFCMPGLPPAVNLKCEAGSFYDEFWGQCLTCNAGKYAHIAGQTQCELCAPGSYSGTGAITCTLCAPGKATTFSGGVACADCTPGKFAQTPGRPFCADCHPGRSQALSGQSGCLLCEVGKYQPEVQSVACNACPGGGTTVKYGSFFEADCVCDDGQYNKLLDVIESFPLHCKACSELLPPFSKPYFTCNGSSSVSPIYVKPGFMSLAGQTQIYKCYGDGKACPYTSQLGVGNPCPPGHEGIACAHCLVDFRWDNVEGKCVACNDRAIAFYILCGILLLWLIFLLRPSKGKMTMDDQLTTVYLYATNFVPLYHFVDLLQYAMVLGAATIPWPERTREFLQRIGSIIDGTFYFIDCHGNDVNEDYAFHYIVWANMLPTILFVAIVIICLPSVLFPKVRLPSFVLGYNLMYSFWSAFFMSIVHFGFTFSMQSYEHPFSRTPQYDGDGEIEDGFEAPASLKFFPNLLVGGSRAGDLRVVSLIMLGVHILFFFIWPVWLIFQLPKKQNEGLKYFTLSLIAKYHNQTSWWFAFDCIFKALTVLSISAWKDPTWEYRMLSLLALLQAMMVLWIKPYRFDPHNWSEVSLAIFKLLILAVALPNFEEHSWVDPEAHDGRVIFLISLGLYGFLLGAQSGFVRVLAGDFTIPSPQPRWDASEGFNAKVLVGRDEDTDPLAQVNADKPKAQEKAKEGTPEVEQSAVMNLRYKHASVLWTLAAHWTKNKQGHIECKLLKEYQQKIIQRLKEGVDLRDLPILLDLNEQLFNNVVRALPDDEKKK
jgi:hypothetical protein